MGERSGLSERWRQRRREIDRKKQDERNPMRNTTGEGETQRCMVTERRMTIKGRKEGKGEMKREGLGKLFMSYPFIIYTTSDFKLTLAVVWLSS